MLTMWPFFWPPRRMTSPTLRSRFKVSVRQRVWSRTSPRAPSPRSAARTLILPLLWMIFRLPLHSMPSNTWDCLCLGRLWRADNQPYIDKLASRLQPWQVHQPCRLHGYLQISAIIDANFPPHRNQGRQNYVMTELMRVFFSLNYPNKPLDTLKGK